VLLLLLGGLAVGCWARQRAAGESWLAEAHELVLG